MAGLRMVGREDNGNFDIGGNFATVYDSSHNPKFRNAFAVLNSNGYDTGFNAQFNMIRRRQDQGQFRRELGGRLRDGGIRQV